MIPAAAVTRRMVLGSALGATVLGATASCGPRRDRPQERSINFGFEDLVTDAPRWSAYADHLTRTDVNALSIAVGRIDWTAFPWKDHPDSAPGIVTESGRDFVAEAIEHLKGDRKLTLTIDTLSPAHIENTPSSAGVNTSGERSGSFPSVTALSNGPAGDLIVELTDEICARYAPHRVALTELMFDDHTFGDDDLTSYQTFTDREDWPRTTDGTIDTEDPSLGQWRSTQITVLLRRVRRAASRRGAKLDMDVRAPWSEPHGDRSMSGHSYDVLLTEADRLVVWNYFAINDSTPEYGARLSESLQRRYPGRFVMSTGLWGKDGALTAAQLDDSLTALAEAQTQAVSVTPASMLASDHWSVLRQAWTG